MGRLLALVLALVTISGVYSNDRQATEFKCTSADNTVFPTKVCFEEGCLKGIEDHIQNELDASFAYMYLASYFDSPARARPGLAKFLYDSAAEERSHAILFLDYLNNRGHQSSMAEYKFGKMDKIEKFIERPSYMKALELATTLEITVTKAIHEIIEKCSGDFHAADFLTQPIIDEQHEGIRKLQAAIKELKNMNPNAATVTKFSEYLLDRKFQSL